VPHYELLVPASPKPATPPRYTEHYEKAQKRGDETGDQPDKGKSLWQRLISSDDPLIFLNLLLDLGTFALAGSTFLLWWVTRRSVAVSERALIDLERPYIVIEVIRSGFLIDSLGSYVLDPQETQWQAVNYGRSPALLIDTVVAFPLVESFPLAIDPEKQRGGTFTAGAVSIAGQPYQQSIQPIPEGDVSLLFETDPELGYRRHKLFFQGYIRYGDFFGGVYVSGFSFTLDPDGLRFVRGGDERYNYNRTEKRSNARK